ncbi:MAG: PqqD family protein [Xanthomonadaceae bacterium]|nr:PqqD family protein [Xanthomonadaceae bacterium]
MQQIRCAIQGGRLTVNRLDDGSGVLLDIEREQLLALNATGMYLIGEVAGGTNGFESLSQALADEFEVTQQRARADVADFLERIGEAI